MIDNDGGPDCVCGEGKMVLLRAGKWAINAGRYYYKCPVDGKHPGWFWWYDEYPFQANRKVSFSPPEKPRRTWDSRMSKQAERLDKKKRCSTASMAGQYTNFK